MHKEFQKALKDNDLSISMVEEAVKCPKNYLSRFINGSQALPGKWEKKIREFLKGVTLAANAGIKPKDVDKFYQKAWVPLIEKYCLEEAGIDPETLIQDHRNLKKRVVELTKSAALVQVKDLTAQAPKSNYTINTNDKPDQPKNWESLSKIEKLKWHTEHRK